VTTDGDLSFQDYFVRRRCEPRVRELHYDGAKAARPSPRAVAALTRAGLDAIIICPSNPYLSIDPMLAVPGFRELLTNAAAPLVGVTPLVGGKALKGPTAKIMEELGRPLTPASVAQHYEDLIDGFVVDERDAPLASGFPCPTSVTDTLMTSLADRERVARGVLEFARSLRQ
jgi:LPPG:FO 2-phospho-L-lactate transferase